MYSIDNMETWQSVTMTSTVSSLYQGVIPGQQGLITVNYKIVAWDNAGNSITQDNGSQYYTYQVLPELSLLGLVAALSLCALILTALRRRESTSTSIPKNGR